MARSAAGLIPTVQQVLNGQRRAIARAVSLVENRDPAGIELLQQLYPHSGNAHVIGITGPPGAGKSTLVAALVQHWRQQGRRVAVIAVDPSSPFTGGAILGDRVRLAVGPRDAGTYFRSLGSRGQLGGVSHATADVIGVLDAAGFGIIILETVGAGQSEVAIMHLAHTVVVLSVPGLGDDVQAAKAGILEVGDIYVVNKADRDGADRVVAELRMMLELAEAQSGPSVSPTDWRPPVIKTVATSGQGVGQVVEAVERHHSSQDRVERCIARRRAHADRRLRGLIAERLLAAWLAAAEAGDRWSQAVADVVGRRKSPYAAAEALLSDNDLVKQFCTAFGAVADRGGGGGGER